MSNVSLSSLCAKHQAFFRATSDLSRETGRRSPLNADSGALFQAASDPTCRLNNSAQTGLVERALRLPPVARTGGSVARTGSVNAIAGGVRYESGRMRADLHSDTRSWSSLRQHHPAGAFCVDDHHLKFTTAETTPANSSPAFKQRSGEKKMAKRRSRLTEVR